jgi:predicted enzyme related to lactoylglutathione lyase
MSQPHGAPSFLELGVPRGAPARDFFRDLLGWDFRQMGDDNFAARTPTLEIGVHNGDEDRCFVVYFAVPDIEAAAERVRALGGKADPPGPAQPGFGRFTECRDPQGVRFGLHQR